MKWRGWEKRKRDEERERKPRKKGI